MDVVKDKFVDVMHAVDRICFGSALKMLEKVLPRL